MLVFVSLSYQNGGSIQRAREQNRRGNRIWDTVSLKYLGTYRCKNPISTSISDRVLRAQCVDLFSAILIL